MLNFGKYFLYSDWMNFLELFLYWICKRDPIILHKTQFKMMQFVFSQLFTFTIVTKSKRKLVAKLQPHYGEISFWNHSFKRFKVMGVFYFRNNYNCWYNNATAKPI